MEETNCLKRQVTTLGVAERIVRVQIKAGGEGKRMDGIGDNSRRWDNSRRRYNSRRHDNKKMAYLL